MRRWCSCRTGESGDDEDARLSGHDDETCVLPGDAREAVGLWSAYLSIRDLLVHDHLERGSHRVLTCPRRRRDGSGLLPPRPRTPPRSLPAGRRAPPTFVQGGTRIDREALGQTTGVCRGHAERVEVGRVAEQDPVDPGVGQRR